MECTSACCSCCCSLQVRLIMLAGLAVGCPAVCISSISPQPSRPPRLPSLLLPLTRMAKCLCAQALPGLLLVCLPCLLLTAAGTIAVCNKCKVLKMLFFEPVVSRVPACMPSSALLLAHLWPAHNPICIAHGKLSMACVMYWLLACTYHLLTTLICVTYHWLSFCLYVALAVRVAVSMHCSAKWTAVSAYARGRKSG